MERKQSRLVQRTGFIRLTLVLGIAILIFSLPLAGSAADKTYVLKAVTAFEKNNIAFKGLPIFMDMVEKESGGRLKINWIGGPEVAKAFDQPEALRSGMIDMILYTSTGYFKPLLPVAECKGLSQMTGPEERESGAFALWEEVFRKYCNAEILGFWVSHFQFQIFSREEIKSLADFQGKFFRVMPLYVPFIKELGASPITMPPPEVYTALQRKVIDGMVWLEFGITPFGWQEVVGYRIEPTVFRGEAAMAVNLDKFNALPQDLQQVLKKCMAKMEVDGDALLKKELEKEHKIMDEKGMKVVKLSEEEGQKMIDISQNVTWEVIVKQAPEYGPRFRELTTKK